MDEDRLRQLEEALAKAQVEVDSSLRPRLQDMEQQENAMRRHLVAVNVDINNIQWDITNLEDILNTVPSGCFNSQPIEAPWGHVTLKVTMVVWTGGGSDVAVGFSFLSIYRQNKNVTYSLT